jgi:uncharacterized membrane protein
MQSRVSSVKRLVVWREMDPEVRVTLLGSLVLAVSGVAVALSILCHTRWIFELNIFFHQFVTHDLPGCILSTAIILVAMVSYRRRYVPLHAIEFLDRYRYSVAGGLTVLLVIGTLTIYHNHPLSLDESVQLFQARVFAAGRICARYPVELLDWLLPYTDSFFRPGWEGGEVISEFWPGFSLLQAPFVLIGVPWLLNPLLAAGALLLIRRLAAELYPDTDAPAWALLFTLASPAFIINSISYYCLPAILFLNLLFTLLLLKGTSSALFLGGLVGSLALVVKNPLPHALYAMPWIAWIMLRRGERRRFVWLVMGYAPLLFLIGAGWAVLRLHLAAQAPARGYISYEVPWRLLSIVSAKAFLATAFYRCLALMKMGAWAVPGLIVLAILGAKAGWRDVRVRVMAASAAFVFGGYFLFLFPQGHGWGYRFFQSAWGTLPLLACGVVAAKRGGDCADHPPLTHVAATLALLSLVFLNGLRLAEVDAWMDRHLSQLPPWDRSHSEVCFIRPWEGYHSVDLVQNDPFLRQNTLFLKSHGRQTEKPFMAQCFPGAVPRSDDPNEAVWYVERDKPDWWVRGGH